MKKNDNSNTPPIKKPKRISPNQSIDPNCMLSWRKLPISEALVNKMIDELPDYPDKNPQVMFISPFYLSFGLSQRNYYDLLKKYPDLKEAHEIAMRKIGQKMYTRSVNKDADWNAVRYRLHSYAPEFEEEARFQARIKADAESSAIGNKEYIYEKVIEYRDKPKND